jgi:hypothetical protein
MRAAKLGYTREPVNAPGEQALPMINFSMQAKRDRF